MSGFWPWLSLRRGRREHNILRRDPSTRPVLAHPGGQILADRCGTQHDRPPLLPKHRPGGGVGEPSRDLDWTQLIIGAAVVSQAHGYILSPRPQKSLIENRIFSQRVLCRGRRR